MHPRLLLKLNSTATSFLDYIISEIDSTSSAESSILIICGQKEDFLAQLVEERDTSNQPTSFELPAWGLLSKSSKLRVFYTPSLPSFRVFLSSLPISQQAKQPVTLFIYDLFRLHTQDLVTNSQVENSVQGLGQTCAILAETSFLMGGRAVVGIPEGEEWLEGEVEIFNSGTKFKGGGGGMKGRVVGLRGVVERCFDVEVGEKLEVQEALQGEALQETPLQEKEYQDKEDIPE